MAWDVQNFINQFRGGFDAGAEKTAQMTKEQELADKAAKADELHQLKIKKEQLSLVEKLMKLFGGTEAPKKDAESPSPTPTVNPMIEALKKGFEEYSMKSGFENPLATASAQMAKAAEENPLPDPYLPAVMNLMETGGSKHMAQPNNYFNWGSNPKPDINTAIDRIYQGIGNTGESGLYKDYLQSGEMSDFFKKYTPSIDPRNPSQEELIKRYTKLRKYFPEI